MKNEKIKPPSLENLLVDVADDLRGKMDAFKYITVIPILPDNQANKFSSLFFHFCQSGISLDCNSKNAFV